MRSCWLADSFVNLVARYSSRVVSSCWKRSPKCENDKYVCTNRPDGGGAGRQAGKEGAARLDLCTDRAGLRGSPRRTRRVRHLPSSGETAGGGGSRAADVMSFHVSTSIGHRIFRLQYTTSQLTCAHIDMKAPSPFLNLKYVQQSRARLARLDHRSTHHCMNVERLTCTPL